MIYIIITSGKFSYGHYKVGEFLHKELRKANHKSYYFTDQEFLGPILNSNLPDIYPLDSLILFVSQMPRQNVHLLLDSIPFRRQNLIFQILSLKKIHNIKVTVGHVGYFPELSKKYMAYWRELLGILGVKNIFVYHNERFCNDVCDIKSMENILNTRTIHTGLLAEPIQNNEYLPPSNKILVMSGGGHKFNELKNVLEKIISKNEEFDFTLLETHYSNFGHDLKFGNLEYVKSLTNVSGYLTSFYGTISRSGYGTCVDVIQSGKPALFFPINREQQLNQLGTCRFVKSYLSLKEEFKIAEVQNNKCEPVVFFNLNKLLENINT